MASSVDARYAFGDEDTADAAAADERKAQHNATRKNYDTMTAEEVFAEFDTDGSGAIDWAEFKAMLPQLGVAMNEAKALKYFNMCDTDGGGDIGLEEFRSALFAVDPNGGNSTGFRPSVLLTPQDSFELFDVDNSGFIDEDEFFFVMEYLNVQIDEMKQEKLFNKYDDDGSGQIDYEEFKMIWLEVANLKKELTDREIKFPKFATKAQLMRIMKKVLDKEEEEERHALAEADQFKRWQKVLKEKRKLSSAAKRRSLLELRTALDLAGQVYSFGQGAYGQFSQRSKADAFSTAHAPFTGFDEIAELWHGRVVPTESFLAKVGQDDDDAGPASTQKPLEELEPGVDMDVDDPRTELLYSPFRTSICASNTCGLWGRRIAEVKLCANVAVARSEFGELFAWGGNSQWWHEVEVDSIYRDAFKPVTTPRSSMLLMNDTSSPPPEDTVLLDEEDPAEAEANTYKEVLQYFGIWKPPPPAAPRLAFYKDTLFPQLDYEWLKVACECRGKETKDMNKVALMERLQKDMRLERRVLGLRAHRRFRESEEEVHYYRRRKKKKSAQKVIDKLMDQWAPVKEMQAEAEAEEEAEARKAIERRWILKEKGYAKTRAHKHMAHLDGHAAYTPRGGSLDIKVSAITARGGGPKRKSSKNNRSSAASQSSRGSSRASTGGGGDGGDDGNDDEGLLHTARGYANVAAVACGENHIAAVHQSGELYTWGFGAAGRLGLDNYANTNADGSRRISDVRADATRPTLVRGLLGRPVVSISCGYSHSAAITVDARVFVWGSGSNGKLGQGPITEQEECFAATPIPVQVGDNVRVRMVSCGAAHTGVITDFGEVYVWGCGDGGRLGLGASRMGSVLRPVRVAAAMADDHKPQKDTDDEDPNRSVVGKHLRVEDGVEDGGEGGGGATAARGGGAAAAAALLGAGAAKGAREKLDERLMHTAAQGVEKPFGNQRAAQIACGNAHTLVATAVKEVTTGHGANRVKKRVGGDVYMAGAQSVLGIFCPSFVKCEQLSDLIIDKVSAGFAHCGAAAATGELYCWGSNFSGCCGAPFPAVQFCYEPFNVPCIFEKSSNLALGKPAAQSTVYNGMDAYLGVDGDFESGEAEKCLSTQCEAQPWWDLDLGDYCCVDTIRVWNRTDEPHDPSFDQETFRERLFPAYVLLAQHPFPRDRDPRALRKLGPNSDTLLDASLNAAIARCKLTKNQRCSTWHVPANTTARYVRVMLEGLNFLHFAQVEVWGTPGISRPVGKCGAVECGRNVTTVVIHASREPQELDAAYRRAVRADAHNGDLLRQYETFALEFDKHGRGEAIVAGINSSSGSAKDGNADRSGCSICKGGALCEICTLEARYQDEIDGMPLLPRAGAARASLDEVIAHLMGAPKPPLNYTPKSPPKKRGITDLFTSSKTRKKREKAERRASMKEKAAASTPSKQESVDEDEGEGDVDVEEDDDDSTLPEINGYNW